MTQFAREFNFDGIVGPSHNYAGLAYGNVASSRHKDTTSNPRAAALEGLEKMRRVAELGVAQAVLPPLRRPRLDFLRKLGFDGGDSDVIDRAAKTAPELLAACYSASSMWTANAATVSPSPDCADGRVHVSVANLTSMLHRAFEAKSTLRNLRWVFGDDFRFAVHGALPPAVALTDEGAANHTRLCSKYGSPGLEIFTYGRSAIRTDLSGPTQYPARQTLEASQAIARRHALEPRQTIFVQQRPEVIDAGVFHNDVIAVGNQNVLICHERAFVDQATTIAQIRQQFEAVCGDELVVIEVCDRDLSLEDAVRSYLFNSQLLSLADGTMALICPHECREIMAASDCLDHILAGDNPIVRAIPLNLRQSMQNGGGPACLRLRVVLNEIQLAAIHPGVIYSAQLHARVETWVKKHYRERLNPADLMDPHLPLEIEAALAELASILQFPPEVMLDA